MIASTASRRCSPRRPRSAPSRRRTRRARASDYDISCFKTLFLAGERLDPDTYHWASDLLGIPVIDHWWQTETGWPIAANCMGSSRCRSSPGRRRSRCPATTCGSSTRTASEVAAPATRARSPSGCPLPPGRFPTLWNDDDRYVESLPRRASPATTSPATAATSTTTATCSSWAGSTTSSTSPATGSRPARWRRSSPTHPDVAECAVIGVADELKGQVPRRLRGPQGRRQPAPSRDRAPSWCSWCATRSGRWRPSRGRSSSRGLPKTRSGKILRGTMRGIADGRDEPCRRPSTTRRPRRAAPAAAPRAGLTRPEAGTAPALRCRRRQPHVTAPTLTPRRRRHSGRLLRCAARRGCPAPPLPPCV